MKRQPYFPRTIDKRPEWFGNFATQLIAANATLGLPADDVTDIVADARFCEYACGEGKLRGSARKLTEAPELPCKLSGASPMPRR